jgi:hypothetical protein
MKALSMTRDLPFSADAFWTSFLDSAFVLRVFPAIGFAKYDILEVRDERERLVRRSDALPPLEAPPVVRKVLGPSFGYVEEGEFDRATKTWTWKATPSVLADRSRFEGTLRVEALGADRCRTNFEATIEVRMLGVGGLVEIAGERSMRTSWTKFGDCCEAWIQSYAATADLRAAVDKLGK